MSDLTPAELAAVRALVGTDWDRGLSSTDIGTRDTAAYLAQQAVAAARPHIEAEALREAASGLRQHIERRQRDADYFDPMLGSGVRLAADWLNSSAKRITRIAEGGERRDV